eukprot:TRINITY_DN1408_c0_g1_i1.p1 TRINITY_DN1408_c0_g1~~TRINITY_DN1408_c0_g1_i1.p1  ORF type:complete len:186 (-),score=34.90 TRINITY_DN1408_c0_g1_i1:118-675(-)
MKAILLLLALLAVQALRLRKKTRCHKRKQFPQFLGENGEGMDKHEEKVLHSINNVPVYLKSPKGNYLSLNATGKLGLFEEPNRDSEWVFKEYKDDRVYLTNNGEVVYSKGDVLYVAHKHKLKTKGWKYTWKVDVEGNKIAMFNFKGHAVEIAPSSDVGAGYPHWYDIYLGNPNDRRMYWTIEYVQ